MSAEASKTSASRESVSETSVPEVLAAEASVPSTSAPRESSPETAGSREPSSEMAMPRPQAFKVPDLQVPASATAPSGGPEALDAARVARAQATRRRPRLVVAAPLRLEAWAAARSGLPAGTILIRTGMGPEQASRSTRIIREARADAIALVGLGGGLGQGVKPGHVVVANEVRTADGSVSARCPSAPLLAGELRRQGLTVHVGPVVSVARLAIGTARAELAATGAIAVDMESAQIAPGANGVPLAIVRVIVDTDEQPLGRLDLARRGIAGLRTMMTLGPVLERWSAVVGSRQVLLAEPRAFCAGVERAIEVVERALDLYGAPVYVRKQIVHNSHVVADLAQRGAVFVEELDEVPAGATVVFSAHGVAPAVWEQADDRSLSVIDATCPLVEKVHAEARRFTARGDTVLLIGHAGHEEVDGTLGEAPGKIKLVESPADVTNVEVDDPERVTYLMQTTLAVDEAEEVVDALRDRFPSVIGPGSADICYATSNRQNAIRRVAIEADVVLVVGSENSANSRRLVDVTEREGVPAYLVGDVGDVDMRWLVGADTIGISAGASAPPTLVDELTRALSGLGPTTVAVRSVGAETISFHLPKELRRQAK